MNIKSGAGGNSTPPGARRASELDDKMLSEDLTVDSFNKCLLFNMTQGLLVLEWVLNVKPAEKKCVIVRLQTSYSRQSVYFGLHRAPGGRS